MTYDHWKTTNAEERYWRDEPPEVVVTCDECGGEGCIEVYESVSRWSIDPPCGYAITCPSCKGQGVFIEEAEADHVF